MTGKAHTLICVAITAAMIGVVSFVARGVLQDRAACAKRGGSPEAVRGLVGLKTLCYIDGKATH